MDHSERSVITHHLCLRLGSSSSGWMSAPDAAPPGRGPGGAPPGRPHGLRRSGHVSVMSLALCRRNPSRRSDLRRHSAGDIAVGVSTSSEPMWTFVSAPRSTAIGSGRASSRSRRTLWPLDKPFYSTKPPHILPPLKAGIRTFRFCVTLYRFLPLRYTSNLFLPITTATCCQTPGFNAPAKDFW